MPILWGGTVEMSNKFALIRQPVLPEDEGRYFLIGVCGTRAKVKNMLENETSSFFKKSDFLLFVRTTDRMLKDKK